MSSFSQAIANLRNNLNARKNESKGYNLDEAKFESQRLQDQGRLFLLAGDLGANLTQKLATRRLEEQKNDFLVGKLKEEYANSYLGSDEAENASQILMQNDKDQNAMSLELSNIEAANPDFASVAREGKESSGALTKIADQMDLDNAHAEWPARYASEILNNTDMIEVRIPDEDGTLRSKFIPVNGANLTELEKLARLNYLSKKYLSEKGISKYNDDFLFLPKDRGGSGFALEMIKNNNVIKKAIEFETKVAAAEYEIGITGKAFTQNEKTPQSLGKYLIALKGGYNKKGEIRTWAETWKEFETNMDQFLENGVFTVPEILSFSNNYKFQMNGKEMSLAEYKPGLWAPTDKDGVQGKYITKAFEAKGKRDLAIAQGVDQTVVKMVDGLKDLKQKGQLTSETDINVALAQIVKVSNSADGTKDVDISALRKEINAIPTQETSAIAEKLLEDYDKRKITDDESTVFIDSEFRLPLEKQLQKYGDDVENHPLIQVRLQEENDAKAEVQDILDVVKKNEQTSKLNNEKIAVWQFKNASAEKKYYMVEAYAVDLILQNNKKSGVKLDLNEIRAKVESFVKDNTATLGTTWDKFNEATATDYEKKVMNLPFTKDSNGEYNNLNTLGLPLVNNEEIKEIRKELIGAEVIKPYDFTNRNTVIPAEQKVFASYQNQFEDYQIDYNDLLEDIGYVPDSLVDIAATQGLTTYEFLYHRMKAFGKEINPKYKQFLNEKEVSTLPSAMKKRLTGETNDNKYTNQEVPAYISRTSNLAGAALTMSFKESGESFVQGIATNYEAFAANINDEGEFTGDAESDKALIGFMSGLGMSLDPKVFNDFNEGGQAQFVGAIKQNLSLESLPSLLMDEDVGFNAYSTSGDINYLPVVDSLKDTKGQDNLNKLMQKLAKFWEQPETEESETEASTEATATANTTGTDIIDESLNTN